MSDDDVHPEAMEQAGRKNLTWHPTSITTSDRYQLAGHRGLVLWFTGLSGSGKSTIANEVDVLLHRRKIHTYLLDGDNIRHGLCKDLGFSSEERTENIRRIGEVANLMSQAGLVVLAAFISPHAADRNQVKECVGEGTMIEVFVNASVATCEARDPKGLYKKARAGIIPNFTGVTAPYEQPEDPEIVLDADTKSVPDLALQVVNWIESNGKLQM